MKDLSVLLVEDNRDDEWLTLRALKKMGVEKVTVARDGLAALSLLLGHPEQGEGGRLDPDLILLDLRLHKIDGLDVMRKIRGEARTSKTKVLVLTSSEDPHDIEVCKKLGVADFSCKPLEERSMRGLKLA